VNNARVHSQGYPTFPFENFEREDVGKAELAKNIYTPED